MGTDAAQARLQGVERALAHGVEWAQAESARSDAFVRRNGGQVVKPNEHDKFLDVLRTIDAAARPERPHGEAR